MITKNNSNVREAFAGHELDNFITQITQKLWLRTVVINIQIRTLNLK